MVCILFCLCISLLCPAAHAYDYRSDAFEGDEIYPSVMDERDKFLEEIYTADPQMAQSASTRRIEPFGEGALKVFNCTMDDLYQILEAGFDDERASALSYSWLIPVSESGTGHSGVVVTPKENGEFSYHSWISTANGKWGVEHLFDQTLIPRIIAEYQEEQPEQLAVLSVGELGADIVVFSSGDGLCCIPFADRPDFLQVENGTVYTAAELTDIIQAYQKQQSGGLNFLSGGGAGGPLWITVPLAAAVLAALLIWKHRRSK